MLSKIQYRRILPTLTDPPALPSTASHPHRSPAHTGVSESSTRNLSNLSSCKRNLPNDQEERSSQDDCIEGGCPSNNNPGDSKEYISEEKDLTSLNPSPDDVRRSISDSQVVQTTDDSSSVAPVKVSLGEITEVKGVIFDMDGTLTLPVLNFAEMKKKVGLKPTDDILPAVQRLPLEEREKAMVIIEQFEQEGVNNMKVRSLIFCYGCSPALLKAVCVLNTR